LTGFSGLNSDKNLTPFFNKEAREDAEGYREEKQFGGLRCIFLLFILSDSFPGFNSVQSL
jgi:hypothetical protein